VIKYRRWKTWLKKKDNFDIPTNFFCGDSHDATNGEGILLKEKIDAYRGAVLAFLEEKAIF